jgi:hypothetical protein
VKTQNLAIKVGQNHGNFRQAVRGRSHRGLRQTQTIQ